MTKALHWCVLATSATPGRRRWSTERQGYKLLAEDYRAFSRILGRWERDGVPPVQLDPLVAVADPRFVKPAQILDPRALWTALASFGSSAQFRYLAKLADRQAALFPRDDGRPRSLGGIASSSRYREAALYPSLIHGPAQTPKKALLTGDKTFQAFLGSVLATAPSCPHPLCVSIPGHRGSECPTHALLMCQSKIAQHIHSARSQR
jgi:hypothetical protein